MRSHATITATHKSVVMKSTLCIILFLSAFVTSRAQTKKEGFYLDAHVAYNSVGKGFDGESAVVAANDVFAVPSFVPGTGYGLAVGVRDEKLYMELAFQRTEHDFLWLGIKGTAVHSMWSLNLRRVIFKNSRLQPFLQLGWTPVMPIRVHDGALMVNENISSDAIFIGNIANGNVGGGIEFAIRPKISVRFSALYKRARYRAVQSSEEQVPIELDQEIKADDMNMSFGLIFVF